MAYEFDDDLPRAQRPVRQAPEVLSTTYITALVVWFGPAILVGMLMLALNLSSYDTILSLNLEDGEDFMRTEQRKACGWPYVLASVVPATQRWSLSMFGVVTDVIIALAAMIITAGTCRFVAAFVDDTVNKPIHKQVRRILRGRPNRTQSGTSSRTSPPGSARARRPRPRTDDQFE
jgi:hypothetical protein